MEHVLISNLLLLLLAGGAGGGDCSRGGGGTLRDVGKRAGTTVNGLHEAGGGFGGSALAVLGKGGHHLGNRKTQCIARLV